MRVLTKWLLLGLCAAANAAAQTNSAPAPKTEAQLDAEATEADALYKQAKTLAALPMYAELHARRPANLGYTERLAMAYVAKAGADEEPAQAIADRNRARTLFAEVQKGGDTSDLVQVMVEKMGAAETSPAAGATAPPPPTSNDPRAPGGAFARAEILFNKGDLKGAVELYGEAWKHFPQFYSAPLYAGDSEYKLGHFDEAGVWFARAIAIDADYETAHRYWADCLLKAGKPAEAHKQYVEALLGDPYQKAPRLQLRSFAEANHLHYIPPAISLPAEPTMGKDGHINITLSPTDPKDPVGIVAMTYSMNAAAWHGDRFKKEFPNEKVYRHTLREEVEGLKMMLAVLREGKIAESRWTPTLRSLAALEKDNMLECWVLLDAPDQGTAQDFVAYRKAHKDLLRAYVEKYDLHPA